MSDVTYSKISNLGEKSWRSVLRFNALFQKYGFGPGAKIDFDVKDKRRFRMIHAQGLTCKAEVNEDPTDLTVDLILPEDVQGSRDRFLKITWMEGVLDCQLVPKFGDKEPKKGFEYISQTNSV